MLLVYQQGFPFKTPVNYGASTIWQTICTAESWAQS